MDDLEALAAAAGNPVPVGRLDTESRSIFVFEAGQEWGPYTQAEVYQYLGESRFSTSAYGRYYTEVDWRWISDLVPIPPHLIPRATMAGAERYQAGRLQQYSDRVAHGDRNPAMICPHCEKVGQVHTKRVDRRVGVSGTKAAAALLTGGMSMLAAGLSRHQQFTQGFCANCRNVWEF